MKLDIPKFRYLAQDANGDVWSHEYMPYISFIGSYANRGDYYYHKDLKVKPNKNWENTLIDLETDDYEFEDGILRRIEK